jgi:hypothetical protein
VDAYPQAGETDVRFVDPQGLLGATDDARVVRDEDALVDLVAGLYDGDIVPDLLVFTSIVQTMASLPKDVAKHLQRYFTEERGAGETAVIAASELWRTRSVFDEWYKLITSAGTGVWVGSGFSDQSVYRFARSLPEYRMPAERSDGFYVAQGNVVCVRLLEAHEDDLPDGI